MIGEILPATVAFAEAFADPPDVVLFPEEEALLVRAVEKRRREFGTARHCARTALGALGVPPAPILPGEAGAPQWPAGIVGSITHCAGYRAAVVARAHDVLTIGIDAEPDQSLPGEVLALVSRPAERARLADLASAAPGVSWDRLLFSAKESVYKAWFPLARRWLGFADADITINPEDGTFDARLLVPGPLVPAPVVGAPVVGAPVVGAPVVGGTVVRGTALAGLAGRWLARDGVILTAITVPGAPGAPLA